MMDLSRVDDLIPNQIRTKKVLDQVSAEYGGEVRSLAGHKGAVTSVAYSPDGDLRRLQSRCSIWTQRRQGQVGSHLEFGQWA